MKLNEIFVRKDFEIESVLEKPLMAHLSTVDEAEPRDSAVWFIWEENTMWVFGMHEDSFVKRIKRNPSCAVSVVDFDLDKGILKHVGMRGMAYCHEIKRSLLERFLLKYLGKNKELWNKWFIANIVEPLNCMIQITPKTIVAKDLSFFKKEAL